jgi:hypothetical protein
MNGKTPRMLMAAALCCGFLLAVEPMGRLNDERIGPGGNTVVSAGNPTKFGRGLVTIDFDDQKPGTYQTLTIQGVTFTARNGKGFQIASLSRRNTSPPYAPIIPQPEYVDLTFDPDDGTMTGIGVTQGLISKNPAGGDRSVFGYTTHFPNRWTSYPIPGYASLMEYQPSPPETEISFRINLTSNITGWYDGVEQKTRFGYLRGVVDDGSFHGQPGLGYDGGAGSGTGAFFDDLTIERAMGDSMPYRLNGSCKEQIDIIFMPDKKYGDPVTSFPTYYRHLSDLVEKGLEKNAVFKANKEKLNFYYLDEQATINYVLAGHCSGMAYAPSAYAGWGFDTYTGQGFGNAFPFADAAVIRRPWMSVITADSPGKPDRQ